MVQSPFRPCQTCLVRVYPQSALHCEKVYALPLLNTSVFPTAFCHMVALSFVGIPAHQSFRNAGFRRTTVQSGTISRSQWWMDSSIFCSRANRRSCNAFRLFSSVNQCTGKTVNRLSR